MSAIYGDAPYVGTCPNFRCSNLSDNFCAMLALSEYNISNYHFDVLTQHTYLLINYQISCTASILL